MPNSYFQFKQFRVEQGKAAMKVTTEGCIFGGLVEVQDSCVRVLDIGAGTGLLSLMIAQKRTNVEIEAVEIEQDAYDQCQHNFSQSPWTNRLQVIHHSVQNFKAEGDYDLIISNPPFFKNSLKGAQKNEQLAKHELGLTQRDLIDVVIRLLSDDGAFWVLYPEQEADQFQQLALLKGLYCQKEWIIRNHSQGPAFRIVRSYSKKGSSFSSLEFVIKNEGEYTPQFINLLSDFYLALD
ncbi:tRNA1(Val) (adenine(37)-N6)-methyltransferase [Marinoscillum sp. MHG1-6]|uniref:tRNA1(Val) (adenine(37)-N6)-methyltransferase n=1 Tax=Marinoscillum sp. MHG1-6 TaxID=2959627 RepID=UPI0021585B2A|nr:methyltransferase [Marinoscillum sp. MHG1-6]